MSAARVRKQPWGVVAALVAAPVLLAFASAQLVDDARVEAKARAEEQAREEKIASGRYVEFCASILEAAGPVAPSSGEPGTPASPAQLADAIEAVDLSRVDIDSAPVALQRDLRAVVAGRADVIAALRTLEPGQSVADLPVPPELLASFLNVVTVGVEECT